MPDDVDSTMQTEEVKYYLLKAEPDSRIVKGKDVKFSVDDFESVQTSPWEGVRNFEARNIMKEMKIGDKALFYHSNCKVPGIAAFAEVSKEAYPDYTAWDTKHPYFDAKTDQENPKWFMVDLTFTSRTRHFVPLALLRYISTVKLPKPGSSDDTDDVPDLIEEIAYLGRKGVAAIQGMGLVTRGRLSVQRVNEEEWHAISLLAERGGWEDLDLKKLGVPLKPGTKVKSKGGTKGRAKKSRKGSEVEEETADESEPVQTRAEKPSSSRAKAKAKRPLESPGERDVEEENDDLAEVPPGRRASKRITSQTSSNPRRTKSSGKRRKIE